MTTAVTKQEQAQLHTPKPTRLRHQRLRDALRELPAQEGHVAIDAVRAALRELLEQGWLDLPLPGSKDTRTRFRCFLELGAHDLSLARLAQGHADAIAMLREAGREPVPGAAYGIWAGQSPERILRAECTSQGWLLHGELPFCPGASTIDRALIVARLPEPMVFDVPRGAMSQIELEACPTIGLASADAANVVLEGCRLPVDNLIATPGFYTSRRGQWAASIGESACWLGGAVGVYRAWQSQEQADDEHAQAHLGAAFASLSAAGQVLHDAAHAIDAGEGSVALQRRALWTRHIVESSCLDVLSRANRALGETSLLFNAAQERRLSDLPVYMRRASVERDLAALGEQVFKLSDVNWL